MPTAVKKKRRSDGVVQGYHVGSSRPEPAKPSASAAAAPNPFAMPQPPTGFAVHKDGELRDGLGYDQFGFRRDSDGIPRNREGKSWYSGLTADAEAMEEAIRTRHRNRFRKRDLVPPMVTAGARVSRSLWTRAQKLEKAWQELVREKIIVRDATHPYWRHQNEAPGGRERTQQLLEERVARMRSNALPKLLTTALNGGSIPPTPPPPPKLAARPAAVAKPRGSAAAKPAQRAAGGRKRLTPAQKKTARTQRKAARAFTRRLTGPARRAYKIGARRDRPLPFYASWPSLGELYEAPVASWRRAREAVATLEAEGLLVRDGQGRLRHLKHTPGGAKKLATMHRRGLPKNSPVRRPTVRERLVANGLLPS